jgi:hypothetical protein
MLGKKIDPATGRPKADRKLMNELRDSRDAARRKKVAAELDARTAKRNARKRGK